MRNALKLTKLFVVDQPIDPDLGITHFISEWINHYGYYPTFQFNQILNAPSFRLIMNLLKRDLLMRYLDVTPEASLAAVLANRLNESQAKVFRGSTLVTKELRGLGSLPIMRHQPQDAGKYLTSFVGSLIDPDTGSVNLGIYRILVIGEDRAVIFMDPRTDAYKIAERWRARGAEALITLYNGGPLSTYLAAAAAIKPDLDSYEIAAKLADRLLILDNNGYPPAPTEAEIIIHGKILSELATEAPFGEFKGYYCQQTHSPVLMVEKITCRSDPYFLGIFCGKESGLTLMSVQNEFLIFQHLSKLGFELKNVSCPRGAFGEFLTLIETPSPSSDMLHAAMSFDKRTKIVVVAQNIEQALQELSIFDFEVHTIPYIKRGKRQGQRLGIVVNRTAQYEWTEY
jgi:4-hydroxy-3-polyprenylbenzoate decarboxylase